MQCELVLSIVLSVLPWCLILNRIKTHLSLYSYHFPMLERGPVTIGV